jgi:CRP/FNR family transcriptional regulator
MKPLLGNVSEELASILKKRGNRREFGENEEIFAEGDDASFLPIVITGRVKMVHFLENGKEVIIGIFHAGEMFAVPPVIDGKRYPAAAMAMEKTKLLLLNRRAFLDLINESGEFAFAVIEWMSAMLREKTATIQNLATASPEHRVGNVLLKIAKDEGDEFPVRISLRREDIANMAGLTTETTIRVIRRLAKQGLLSIDHGKIVIDDNRGLRQLVEG